MVKIHCEIPNSSGVQDNYKYRHVIYWVSQIEIPHILADNFLVEDNLIFMEVILN